MHIELTLSGVVSAHIRHQKTDYDRLMKKHGLSKTEALLVVQDEIDEIQFDWSRAGQETRNV